MRKVRSLGRNQQGATSIEYALICSLIVLAIMGGVQLFASKTISMLNNVATKVNDAS